MNHQHYFGPGGLRCACGAWHPEVSSEEIARLLRVARELDAISAQHAEMSRRNPLPATYGGSDYRFPSYGEMAPVGLGSDY